MTIEVQCSSCHTRYRIDEQVLPEGTPTFKCSRCGHVFTVDPRSRTSGSAEPAAASSDAGPATATPRAPRSRRESRQPDADRDLSGESATESPSAGAADSNDTAGESASAGNDLALNRTEATPAPDSSPISSPAVKKPTTDELFSKSFRDEEPPGENLKFDFNEEPQEPETPAATATEIPDDQHRDEWQVGETDFEGPAEARAFSERSSEQNDTATSDRAPARSRRTRVGPPKRSTKKESEDFLDEHAAPIYNHSMVTHSSRFFVGLFILIAVGYGVMTVLIRSAPATAAEILSHLPQVGDRFIPPVAPARLVAMRDVHSDYLQTKGGHAALVVTGIAENVSNGSLHAIQIAASLHDSAQHTLATRTVYCGNNLSAPLVAQMTPHELDFFQKLDPPKAFVLEPAGTSPFVIVFIDPPAAVSRFDVAVASAGAAAPPLSGTGG